MILRVHTQKEFLRDNKHILAVKHHTNSRALQLREEEGHSFKVPAPCWEEKSVLFWKSLSGGKQINVQGELQQENVCGRKRIQTHSRVYSKKSLHLSLSLFCCLIFLSYALSWVVFHHLSFSFSLYISQQLSFFSWLCASSVLLNQSLSILSNANTLLSLDGYSPSDCKKMKNGRITHSPDFSGPKVVFFSGKHVSSWLSISNFTC